MTDNNGHRRFPVPWIHRWPRNALAVMTAGPAGLAADLPEIVGQR